MFFQRFKTPGLAHNAYLLASNKIGIVVDPRRDIEDYLKAAQENGITISYVLETHRQEDFIMGSRALKETCGAEIVGGDHEIFRHCDRKLRDGEEFKVGELTLRALATPGHTPESMSYAVFQSGKKDCWCVFTGDALFVGDAGRTDLPDKDKTAENAGILFDAIHEKILPLGPQTLLYPAHGAGSVCGGNIADYDESSIGFEMGYSPAFTLTRDEFIEHKVNERIPRPPYFTLMEKINIEGGKSPEASASEIPVFSPEDFQRESRKGVVIDTRLPESFAGGHIESSYSIWLGGLPVFGGHVAPAETPFYLVLEDSSDLSEAHLALTRIGMDNIAGVLRKNFESWRNSALPLERSGTISPKELHGSREDIYVLDVREISEFEEGHIPGAHHCFVGDLGKIIDEIPRDQKIVVTCSVGHRAGFATSILLRAGIKDVSNLLGGMTAWKKLDYPVSKGEYDKSFFEDLRNTQPAPLLEQTH